MESILTSIKKLIGLAEDDTSFDVDVIMHINTSFNILNGLGVGPAYGFSIKDSSAKWSDFLQDEKRLEMVKTYVYSKVKLVFDSSNMSSAAIESLKEVIKELEWRITNTAENL